MALPTDQIRLDTSKTPWMAIARREEGKKIHELAADDKFVDELRWQLTIQRTFQATEQQLSAFENDSVLLGRSESLGVGRQHLKMPQLRDPTDNLLGEMEAKTLRDRNPEIGKYFVGLKTDPAYDKKGRSWGISPTHGAGGRGQVTAWCAAFVHYCLSQSDAPSLAIGTARSWLEFGTPIVQPVYGCIAVMKPSKSTGSTTGHVAFFFESAGDHVILLGGNQKDQVSRERYKVARIVGYRWPTLFNHYLAADPPRQMSA